MSISPWVILAICLSAAAIAGILALHFWRAHVDARRQQQEKDASADPEKALPVENQQQQQQMQQQQQPANADDDDNKTRLAASQHQQRGLLCGQLPGVADDGGGGEARMTW
ncbi:hypothetical protein SLS57_006939 [Botryosphaeria dothidea]